MILSQRIKDYATEKGADLVGIAPVERFDGAPKSHRPEDFLADARSVIAMVKRIPLSIVKTIPGPYYEKIGYHDINAYLRALAYDVSIFLEDVGYEAFPLDPSVDDRARDVQIIQEEPEPKVKILGDFSHRHAVVLSGLGEISAASTAVVPRFGPRVRLVSVITAAPLEPDPVPGGEDGMRICKPEACGSLCVAKCPAKALAGDGTVDHLKCRGYRNPSLYTLDYFKQIAASNKSGGPTPSSPGGGAPRAVGQTCGYCIKVCPIGMDL